MQLDVMITQSILGAQCVFYSIIAYRMSSYNNLLKAWVVSFFILLALAVITGGIVNGVLLNEENDLIKEILWHVSLLCLGIATSTMWNMGAATIKSRLFMRIMFGFSIISFIFYYIVLLLVSSDFFISIVYYTLASSYLLVIFIFKFFVNLSKSLVPGIMAIFLVIIATCLQQLGFELLSLKLSSKSIFNILITLSVYLLFFTIKYLLRSTKTKINEQLVSVLYLK